MNGRGEKIESIMERISKYIDYGMDFKVYRLWKGFQIDYGS